MTKSKLNLFRLLFVGVTFLAATGVVFAFYTPRESGRQNQQNNSVTTLMGKLICLPHIDNDGPQTAECAMGVLLDDGKTYYAVRDTTNDYRIIGSLPFNKRIRLTGSLLPKKEADQYQSQGIFEVTKAEVIE